MTPIPCSRRFILMMPRGGSGLARKKKEYVSNREEEKAYAQHCLCGEAIESRTHTVTECELHKEERDVLEGDMREVGEGGMSSFDILDNREKTIAILGDSWRTQMAKQDGCSGQSM